METTQPASPIRARTSSEPKSELECKRLVKPLPEPKPEPARTPLPQPKPKLRICTPPRPRAEVPVTAPVRPVPVDVPATGRKLLDPSQNTKGGDDNNIDATSYSTEKSQELEGVVQEEIQADCWRGDQTYLAATTTTTTTTCSYVSREGADPGIESRE